MNHTINFYKQGTGDALMDPGNYPNAIKVYLAEEQKLLKTCLPISVTIVEAGCTTGHYAHTAIKAEKEYLGIDIARHRIDRARQKFKDQNGCRFTCDDISNLGEIVARLSLPFDRTLVIFPFNAFGNVHQPQAILQFLGRAGMKFIISTYKTDIETQKIRTLYYRNCGFEDLTCHNSKEGVRFLDDSGLDTIAYNELWFANINKQYAMSLKTVPLGDIGVAYMNF